MEWSFSWAGREHGSPHLWIAPASPASKNLSPPPASWSCASFSLPQKERRFEYPWLCSHMAGFFGLFAGELCGADVHTVASSSWRRLHAAPPGWTPLIPMEQKPTWKCLGLFQVQGDSVK